MSTAKSKPGELSSSTPTEFVVSRAQNGQNFARKSTTLQPTTATGGSSITDDLQMGDVLFGSSASKDSSKPKTYDHTHTHIQTLRVSKMFSFNFQFTRRKRRNSTFAAGSFLENTYASSSSDEDSDTPGRRQKSAAVSIGEEGLDDIEESAELDALTPSSFTPSSFGSYKIRRQTALEGLPGSTAGSITGSTASTTGLTPSTTGPTPSTSSLKSSNSSGSLAKSSKQLLGADQPSSSSSQSLRRDPPTKTASPNPHSRAPSLSHQSFLSFFSTQSQQDHFSPSSPQQHLERPIEATEDRADFNSLLVSEEIEAEQEFHNKIVDRLILSGRIELAASFADTALEGGCPDHLLRLLLTQGSASTDKSNSWQIIMRMRDKVAAAPVVLEYFHHWDIDPAMCVNIIPPLCLITHTPFFFFLPPKYLTLLLYVITEICCRWYLAI